MEESSIVESQEQSVNSKPWLFQPGRSGNPGGRTKGTISLTRRLEQRLRDNPKEADELIDILLKLCKEHDLNALKEAFNRIDGKPIERHEIDILPPVTYVDIMRGNDAIQIEEVKEIGYVDGTG